MKFGIVCFKVRQMEGGIIIQTADKTFEMRKILNIWEERLQIKAACKQTLRTDQIQ
jgi:hypothetical protein